MISSRVRPELGAELPVRKRETAVEILAEDHLGNRLDQRVIEDLGLVEAAVGSTLAARA